MDGNEINNTPEGGGNGGDLEGKTGKVATNMDELLDEMDDEETDDEDGEKKPAPKKDKPNPPKDPARGEDDEEDPEKPKDKKNPPEKKDPQKPEDKKPEDGEDGDPEKQPEKKPDPNAPAKQKYKLTINGEEKEVELSPDETRAAIQKALAADRNMALAAKWRKQSENLIRMLKTDPFKVLQNPALGLNARELAEKWLYENHVKLENMTPEQRKAHETEMELRNLREEKERYQKEQEEREFEEKKQYFSNEYQKSIIEALKNENLPRTPWTVKRMAYYLHQAVTRGIPNVRMDQVVRLVRQDYSRDMQEFLGQTDGESLLKIAGEDVAKKLREADLARVKGGKPPTTPKDGEQGDPKPRPSKQEKKISMEQWREEMEAIENG